MTRPTGPSLWLQIPYFLLAFPVTLVIILIRVVVELLLTIPARALLPASNWGMYSSKDIEAVRLYIEHFRRLHPELIASFARDVLPRSGPRDAVIKNIPFWPSKSKHVVGAVMLMCCAKQTSYEFSHEAAFFAYLEAVEYPREVVWAFLRDEVERHVALADSMKVEYRRVMALMNSWRLQNALKYFDVLTGFIMEALPEDPYTMPTDVPEGVTAVAVRGDELGWIVSPRVLLVPMDSLASERLRGFDRSFLYRLLKDDDLEKGIGQQTWATFDAR